jgi:hypothetical protein
MLSFAGAFLIAILGVVILNAIMLIVVMLNVVMLSVIILNVVAPKQLNETQSQFSFFIHFKVEIMPSRPS